MKSLRDCVREERKAYKRWQRAKRENWGSYGGPQSEWALFFKWKNSAARTAHLHGVWRPRPGATLHRKTESWTDEAKAFEVALVGQGEGRGRCHTR